MQRTATAAFHAQQVGKWLSASLLIHVNLMGRSDLYVIASAERPSLTSPSMKIGALFSCPMVRRLLAKSERNMIHLRLAHENQTYQETLLHTHDVASSIRLVTQ